MTVYVKEGQNLTEVLSSNGTQETKVVVLPEKVVFREKVFCSADNIIVMGNGSRIVWGDHNGQTPGFGTGDSATLTVSGKNVMFRDLVVENDFDYYAQRMKQADFATRMGLQAVAVFTRPEADSIVFDTCTMLGHQDTFFTDSQRTLCINCTIEGNVDFIFGASMGDFHNCTIVSNGPGFVCAPSTKEETESGLCFFDCDFICRENVTDGSVFLARPWHPGGLPGVNPFALFSHCRFGKHISPRLWAAMMDSKGVMHKPEESRFIISDAE